MAKSPAGDKTPSNTDSTADSATTPAQHIWLAGLGAMAKAQEQGSKAIEALVNDGLAFQRKSQAEAQQRLHEATERLTHMASDFGQQAGGRVDKLEHLFEDRVAKALNRLGMPNLQDMQQLSDRVALLEAQLASLQKAQTTSPAGAPAKPASAKKARTQAATNRPAAAARKKSA